VRPWSTGDTPEVARFDAPAFGADRSRLLATYASEFSESAWVVRDERGRVSGFVVVQDDLIGPWCAADERVGGRLLDVALRGVTRTLRVGVVDALGAQLLALRGFDAGRSLPRMRLGPPVPRPAHPRLLAHASYAVG